MTSVREVFANCRISVDDGFRNEYSYVHYRRWGEIQLWEGGRFKGAPPIRQTRDDCIEVWHNWKLVGVYKARVEAVKHVRRLVADLGVTLYELAEYLEL